MRRPIFVCLGMLALIAFTTQAASAVEGFLPLNKKGVTMTAEKFNLENAKKEAIQCGVLTASGKFESDHHATVTVDLTGCKVLGILAVNTLGDLKEVILFKALFLTCLIDSAKLVFGLALETDELVHLESAAALFFMAGRVIGQFLTVGPGKLWLVDFGVKEGNQTVKECKDEAGGVKKHTLTFFADTKEEEAIASESMTLSEIHFEEEMQLMDK